MAIDRIVETVRAKYPEVKVEYCNHLGKNCGVHFTLQNGYQVSVQWGAYTYSDNHDADVMFPHERDWSNTSETAEVAAWDTANNWRVFNGDTVAGYLEHDEIMEIVDETAGQWTEEEA